MLVELHGSLSRNVGAAIRSARRLRGRPVHEDTIRYWNALLDHVRWQETVSSSPEVNQLVADLESELSGHGELAVNGSC